MVWFDGVTVGPCALGVVLVYQLLEGSRSFASLKCVFDGSINSSI